MKPINLKRHSDVLIGTYNLGHNIVRLFDVLPNFLFSPQVKRTVTVSNKHGIYELLHKLPKDLRFKKYQKNL